MQKSQGFTLIELLVVLFIVGISFTFAVIAFGDFGKTRQARYTAEGMKNTIELYRDQAILESSHFVIYTNKGGFEVFKYESSNPLLVPKEVFVNKINFANGIVISPNIKIDILPSRYITPFTLIFGTASQKQKVKLIGSINGEIEVTN